MIDELAAAAEADRATNIALYRLDNPPKPLKRPAAPTPIARMPSTYKPTRPWGEWDHRWFRAASSITRMGATQCAAS